MESSRVLHQRAPLGIRKRAARSEAEGFVELFHRVIVCGVGDQPQAVLPRLVYAHDECVDEGATDAAMLLAGVDGEGHQLGAGGGLESPPHTAACNAHERRWMA